MDNFKTVNVLVQALYICTCQIYLYQILNYLEQVKLRLACNIQSDIKFSFRLIGHSLLTNKYHQ